MDAVARFGGEEFVALMPGSNGSEKSTDTKMRR
jgi:GGDEF domain-containing protein